MFINPYFYFYFQNSIRHNLSLHKCFIRTTNEGTGKSSWWILDPNAKPEKRTERRRTGSLDTKKFEKKKATNAKKRVDAQRNAGATKASSSPCSQPISEHLDANATNFYHLPGSYGQRQTSNLGSSGGNLTSMNSIPNDMPSTSTDPHADHRVWNSGYYSPNEHYETTEHLADRFEDHVKIEKLSGDELSYVDTSPISHVSPLSYFDGQQYYNQSNPVTEYRQFTPSTTVPIQILSTPQLDMSRHLTILPPTPYSLTTLQTVSSPQQQQPNHSVSPNSLSNSPQLLVDTMSQAHSPFSSHSPCNLNDSGRVPSINVPQDPSRLRAALSNDNRGLSCSPNAISNTPEISNEMVSNHVSGQFCAINPSPYINIDPGQIGCNVGQVLSDLNPDDIARFQLATNHLDFNHVSPPQTYVHFTGATINGYSTDGNNINGYSGGNRRYIH